MHYVEGGIFGCLIGGVLAKLYYRRMVADLERLVVHARERIGDEIKGKSH